MCTSGSDGPCYCTSIQYQKAAAGIVPAAAWSAVSRLLAALLNCPGRINIHNPVPRNWYAEYGGLFHYPAVPEIPHTRAEPMDFHGSSSAPSPHPQKFRTSAGWVGWPPPLIQPPGQAMTSTKSYCFSPLLIHSNTVAALPIPLTQQTRIFFPTS